MLLIRMGKRDLRESSDCRKDAGCSSLSDTDTARRCVIAGFDEGWMSSEGGTQLLPEEIWLLKAFRSMAAGTKDRRRLRGEMNVNGP